MTKFFPVSACNVNWTVWKIYLTHSCVAFVGSLRILNSSFEFSLGQISRPNRNCPCEPRSLSFRSKRIPSTGKQNGSKQPITLMVFLCFQQVFSAIPERRRDPKDFFRTYWKPLLTYLHLINLRKNPVYNTSLITIEHNKETKDSKPIIYFY